MKTTLLGAGALSCALLASTALVTPAFAQANQGVQPAFRGIDGNGVDLVSGTYPFTIAEGSIGSGDTGLSVVRTGTNTYGTATWQNIYISQSVSGSVRTATVVLGDRSETFTSTGGGAFVAAQGNGATLSGGANGDFTYTDAGGTAMLFGDGGVGDQYGASNLCSHVQANLNGCFALASTITRPDGATTSLSWNMRSACASEYNPDGGLDCTYAWRLAGASNSFGYALAFSYVSNSVALNSLPSGDWYKRSGTTLSNGGNSSSISYNYVSSSVTEITDIGSRVWRITTGTNSLGLRRPGSSSDDISVTFSGGIVTQVVRDGITTSYSRSVSGSTATWTITDAASHVTTVVVDLSKGRITSVTDPLSHTTSYAYDSNSRLTRITYPEGNYVNYTYDARGNVTETRAVAKSGSGLDDMVTSASYDASCSNVVTCNQPNSVTDARGNVTDYAYDSTHGGVLSVTAPAASGGGTRPQTRYSYTLTNGEYRLTGVSACASGSTASPTCVGTADESRTVIAYDANGNATSVEQRDGTGALSATNAMTYDGYGNLLTVDGPLSGTGDTTRYRYNAARQMVGAIGPDPDGGGSLHHRALRTTYGSDGLPTKVEQGWVASQSDSDWNSGFTALQEVATEYDAHHRPVVQRLASGGTAYQLTQTSYDSLGRPQCTAQRMNPAEFATASLPADACTPDTPGTGANDYGPDRIARTTYDAAGQVTKVETGYGVSGVAADEMTATYTNNGQVATVTDAEGNMTTYEYDGHDRLLNLRYPSPTTDGVSAPTSGAGNDFEQLSYVTATVGGNPVATPLVSSRRLRDGNSIAYSYDNLGRLTGKNLPGSELDVSYGYDLLGRMTSAATSAQTLTFGFDALGRNTSEAGPHGTVGYGYDLAGQRTSITYPDSGLVAGYVYDLAGEVTEVRENPSGSNTLLASYSYNDRGLRTGISRGNGATTSYAYDNVSRLTQLVQDLHNSGSDLTLDYTLNPAGEIASTTRSNDSYAYTGHANANVTGTANGLNQLTAIGGVSNSHDARGNVSAIGASSYGYSSENLLTSGPSSVTLSYDPANRLAETAGGATTRFGYDGGQLIGEYDSSNALQRRYVFGPGTDEPLVQYEGSGASTRRWFHADERGSVVAVSDGSGDLVGSNPNRYDEYGNVQGTLTGRFGYTGQAWLPEIGMAYYRMRIYNPAMGRFMQTDPIGFGGGMNLYAYVLNNPVNFVDPAGLECASDEVMMIVPHVNERATPGRDGPTVTGPRTICVRRPGQGEGEGQEVFVVGKRPNQPKRPHNYGLYYYTMCTPGELWGMIREPGASAPGAPAAREGFTPRIMLYLGNPISQRVDSGTMTIVNITLPDHAFYPGSVTIQVIPAANNTADLRFTGTGNGANWLLNDIIGRGYFGFVGQTMVESCQQQHGIYVSPMVP